MHPEKFHIDKIPNGRLSAIIQLDGPRIAIYHENRSRWLYTITIRQIVRQIVRFRERMRFEKIQQDQIQNGRLLAIIHLNRSDIG